MIDKVGIQALWILLVVWIYFVAKYFLRFSVPAPIDAVAVIIAIASGIAVLLWLLRRPWKL